MSECLLSILIPTLESRRTLFEGLRAGLETQIKSAGAAEVELLTLCDDGRASVGAKRNQLMDSARGRFIVFIDDDDRVSDDYVAQILESIRAHPSADCICIAGEITFRGRHPRRLVHSPRYTDWYQRAGEYVRPPCHITPIRRDIASRYRFAEIDWSEDMDWAMRMSRDGALRHAAVIDKVLYHYHSRRHFGWQWLLDSTQPVRHALGLRLVSRVGLGRRLKALLRKPRS